MITYIIEGILVLGILALSIDAYRMHREVKRLQKWLKTWSHRYH